MLAILEFIFSSFWTFLGTFILLSLAVKGVVLAIAAIRGANITFGSDD